MATGRVTRRMFSCNLDNFQCNTRHCETSARFAAAATNLFDFRALRLANCRWEIEPFDNKGLFCAHALLFSLSLPIGLSLQGGIMFSSVKKKNDFPDYLLFVLIFLHLPQL